MGLNRLISQVGILHQSTGVLLAALFQCREFASNHLCSAQQGGLSTICDATKCLEWETLWAAAAIDEVVLRSIHLSRGPIPSMLASRLEAR